VTRRASAAVAAAALAGTVLLTGCARELGGEAGRDGPAVATSPDAARTKLRLALEDPCFTDADPRRTWPRCGRWVEETVSTARAATTALPADPAVARAAADVTAGRDAFLARGCPATGPAVPVDAGGCLGALGTTRRGVAALDAALRARP